jgi:DNA gyrase/topoisomerase IV subunit B
MKQNIIKVLNDQEHLLLRGEYILGSLAYVDREQPMLGPAGLEHKTVRYVPALVKMMNEIIDNSVDEAVRTDFKHATKIRVTVDERSFKVEDDGRGIPIVPIDGADPHDVTKLMPVVAFTQARAGANFSDDNRETIGMNGVGAFAANVFSSRFDVVTRDGKKKLKMACSNNCRDIKASTIAESGDTGTTVYFEPDFTRFECKSIDDIHVELIRQRLLFLAATYRDVSFYLNGHAIRFTSVEKFLAQFGETYEMMESKNPARPWFIAFLPSPANEFVHFTYVNGLYMSRGGNHVDNLSYEICSRLRDKAARKFPNIKPADVKNRLSMVAFFSRFPDAHFDSQTKENLANPTPEVKAYLEVAAEDFDKLAGRIWRNEKIMQPILELHQMQEDLKNRRELEKRKPAKKVVSDQYYAPIGDKHRLFLAEGFSAVTGLSGALGRRGNGYFALRGVPLNAYEVTQQKLLANKELSLLIDILQLDLTGKNKEVTYDKIVFATDQDLDGFHIRGLLIAFFNRFAPWLLEQKRIVMLNTPVMVAFEKSVPSRWWFSLGDEQAAIKKEPLKKTETLKYFKGLGTWKSEILAPFVERVGIDTLLVPLTLDKKAPELIKKWMKKKTEDGIRASDNRKEFVGGRSYDIFLM